MAKQATPDVAEASTPEMDTLAELTYEAEPYEPEKATPEPPADEQPAEEPSAAGEAEPTSRRSRRQRAADRGERETKPGKDLDQDADFRAYKATRDAEVAAERRKRSELERQWQEQQQLLQQQQVTQLRRQLDETADDDQRGAIIEQIAAYRGQSIAQQWLQWEQHKRSRIEEEGLEQSDPRFQKQYQGNEGAWQFERDLLAASKEKLALENAALKKAASPQTIEELVKKQWSVG